MILFITDLDGTLLNEEARLDESTKRRLSLLIDRGVNFTVASARAFPSIQTIMRDVPMHLPVVEQNGAIIRNFSDGRILRSETLAGDTAAAVFDVFARADIDPVVSVLDGDSNPLFYRRLDNGGMRWYIEEKLNKNDRRPSSVGHYSKCRSLPVLSYTYLGSEDRVWRLAEAFSDLCADINISQYENSYSGEWEINVNAVAADKGTALNYLRRYADGISSVVAFGDNSNDISMFREADTAVAVGNATPEIKSLATHVVRRNGENGVVEFIEDFISML